MGRLPLTGCCLNGRTPFAHLTSRLTYAAAGTKADLESFRPLASPEHVLVLANAALQSESLKAWAEAEAAGSIAWEGTLLESVDRPAGDALVYGRFAPLQTQQVPVNP